MKGQLILVRPRRLIDSDISKDYITGVSCQRADRSSLYKCVYLLLPYYRYILRALPTYDDVRIGRVGYKWTGALRYRTESKYRRRRSPVIHAGGRGYPNTSHTI